MPKFDIINLSDPFDEMIPAPDVDDVITWLIDEKNIYINIIFNGYEWSWQFFELQPEHSTEFDNCYIIQNSLCKSHDRHDIIKHALTNILMMLKRRMKTDETC